MKQYFGYIRVSTAKQGEHGVSLQEQRDAISHYAERNTFAIAEWFEERETAAKRGRPIFTRMLHLLRRGRAAGVIIHKIDRGARNMKDWAELCDLFDAGVEVYFTNENLDLRSRGGRLSADIQAVVAADFIRNLREETRKGFYGRLKDGLYPLPAPVGYLDTGKGKAKDIDPVKGPLVRHVFELYASRGYSLDDVVALAAAAGLSNTRGGRISRNGFSRMLKNPFYIGLIRLRSTGEMFSGIHEPLVSKVLFDRVQSTLAGKYQQAKFTHDFTFRKLFRCGMCGFFLTGELQKGHVYYRCHRRACQASSVREDLVEEAVSEKLEPLQLSPAERAYLQQKLGEHRERWGHERNALEASLRMKLGQQQERLMRLTDAFLEGTIEKELFQERKAALLIERRETEESLARAANGGDDLRDKLSEFFELAGSAYFLYKTGLKQEKRELLEIVSSNREVRGKNVGMMLAQPFSLLEKRCENTNGSPYRDTVRTGSRFYEDLLVWFRKDGLKWPVEAVTRLIQAMKGKEGNVAA